MDNLYFRIKALYPSLEAQRDFELRDDSDGEGPKIVRWNAAVSQPTEAELLAADWQAAVPDPADIDRLQKTLKALALLNRAYANALKAEVRGLAALLVGKGVISASEATGLTTYIGSGTGNSKTIADLRADFKSIFDSLP